MNWYKNAKTSTKLIMAFALLSVMLAMVGYEGASAAGSLNEMLQTLYETHMQGAASVQEMRTAIPTIGREIADSLLLNDAAERQKCVRNLEEHFAGLDEDTAAAEKKLVHEKDKAEMARFKHVEPQYRALVMDVARLAVEGKDKEARAEMARAKPLGDELAQACDTIVSLKQQLGKQAHEQSDARFASMRRTLLGVVAAAVMVSLLLGIFIARLISRPLARAVEVLRAVRDRDLTRMLNLDTKDEVGQMAQALNQACAGVRDAMGEVRESSLGVSDAAEQLAAAAEELSSGTQEQASSQEETSASLQELSSAVKQNAENARQASQLASDARAAAEKGGAVVNSAVAAMSEINTASKRIAEIITAIDEIAFQTNLLALNAAVEAARAGEQGRGFAVVASEVRSLAQRSATAAKEIKTLIQDSVRKVDAGSELVNHSGETLTEIMASVKRVTDIVAEIAAASHEQASGIEQVSKAMAQMDQVTQTNSAQTEELSSTSQTLAAHAAQMQALVAQFTLDSGPRRQPVLGKGGKPDVSARRSLSRLSQEVSQRSPQALFEEL